MVPRFSGKLAGGCVRVLADILVVILWSGRPEDRPARCKSRIKDWSRRQRRRRSSDPTRSSELGPQRRSITRCEIARKRVSYHSRSRRTYELTISGADKMIKLWDVGQRACVSTNTTTAEVWGFQWQPSGNDSFAVGKQFATAGDDKAVSLYRAAGSL